jgi:cardiolipin synthase
MGWFLATVAVFDAIVIVRAVTRSHGVESTLAWIFAILALPGVGALGYLALASPSIRRAASRKRRRAQPVQSAAAARPEAARAAPGPADTSLLRLAASLTGLEPTAGNRVELLPPDARAFRAIEQAIEAARRSVWAEAYIIRNDETGSHFLDLLERKAREGVSVRILYDAVGSIGIDARRLAAISAAGGRVQAFLPLNPLRRRWAVHLRNHRKLIVVDGESGFTGGMNVGNEYSGRIGRHLAARRGTQRPATWHDTHLLVHGPAVADMAQIFAEDWAFATEEQLELPPACPPETDGHTLAVVPSGPDQRHNANGLTYFAGIAAARQRVWITSAYFVPDQPTMRALLSAALRGVDVRLLVPERGDVALVDAAARSEFPALLRGGVRIFQFTSTVLHAKTMVVDGTWTLVGSANMDRRSFRLNFELGALITGRRFAGELEERFRSDLDSSREIGPEWLDGYGLLPRLRDGAARLLGPLL